VEQLTTSVTAEESYIVVTLAGEVDVTTAQQMRDVLMSQAAQGTPRLIVDLSGLGFMDSSGVRVLLTVRGALEASGRTLALASPQPVVARMLSLVGADQLIPVYGSLGEARSG